MCGKKDKSYIFKKRSEQSLKIVNKCGFEKMLQGLKTASYDAVPQEHIFIFCCKAPA